MSRSRSASVLSVALVSILLAACGQGGARNDGGGLAVGAAAAGGGVADKCKEVTLEATEIGVTADKITITIGADTGSQAIPGMAKGSVEAVEAWAKMVNDEGGLGCRQVEVRHYDSKIDPTESRNAMIDACQNSLAMVGSFMLSVADASQLAECTDKGGKVTGVPDLPALAGTPLHACNATTFLPTGGTGFPCPPTRGVQPMQVNAATGEIIKEMVGDDVHGAYILANTSPMTIALSIPTYRFMQKELGVVADGEIGAKGTDTQNHFTPLVQRMKAAGSNFGLTATTFPGVILTLKEAAAQGLKDVKWFCQSCYDPAFVKAGGDATHGVTALITYLPHEEAAENKELANFLERVKTHNTFSKPSWIGARLFQEAVENVVEKDGPNGITRAALIEALEGIKSWNGHGMSGEVNPNDTAAGNCYVATTVQPDGTWKRSFPKEPGAFHCGEKHTINLDPNAEFKG